LVHIVSEFASFEVMFPSFHPVNSPYSRRNSMSHREGFPTPLSQTWAERMERF